MKLGGRGGAVVTAFTYHQCGQGSQRAKKVVSDSLGLVDFAIGLVIFVLNLPNRQVLFFGENQNYRRTVINPANKKGFWGQLK